MTILLTLLVFSAGCANKVTVKTSAETTPELAGPVLTAPEKVTREDLWDRIRAGFSLPAINSAHVSYYEKWYAARPEYWTNMVARSRLYLYHIVEEVEKRRMPMEIALLPTIESAFKAQAYSRARASGLWQFIPSTGRRFGLKQNWWYDGRRDVLAATNAALSYLQELHEEFDGDWHLALAAYNAGENKVKRTMRYNRRKGRSTKYQALRLKRETRHYVPKLVAVVNIVKNPEKYGLKLASIPNQPYFTQVKVGGQIDLGVVAKLTAMDVNDLYDLNPGFKRWATDPNGPHKLLVPLAKEKVLLAGLSQLPDSKRMQWSRYHVRHGDSLSQIAQRYRISVGAIKSTNKLRGHFIRAGQNLLIPLSSRKLKRAGTRKRAGSAGKGTRVAQSPAGKVRVVHRVRKGDTLWGIARRYNVYIHQLTRWNGIRPNDLLKLGQTVHVWTR